MMYTACAPRRQQFDVAYFSKICVDVFISFLFFFSFLGGGGGGREEAGEVAGMWVNRHKIMISLCHSFTPLCHGP